MKKLMLMLMLMLILAALSLAGCVTKSAPEKHAWYFSQHQAGTLNGNFQSNRSADYRMNLPQFKKLYEQGTADRNNGKNAEYASQYAAAIRKEAEKSHQTKSSFITTGIDQWQDTTDKKDATLWFNELAASYMDGYNRVK